MPVLHTTRFMLRPFQADDLELVFRGLSHPDIIKYYGVSYATLEETKAQMQFFRELEEQETGRWWAICSPDNAVFYGAAGLNGLHKVHRKAEIGFWLLPEHWGKGIIPEVVPAVCAYGFEHMHIHRIEAIVESENTNSRRVMDKLGFVYEGTMTDSEIKNGRFISLAMYAKLEK